MKRTNRSPAARPAATGNHVKERTSAMARASWPAPLASCGRAVVPSSAATKGAGDAGSASDAAPQSYCAASQCWSRDLAAPLCSSCWPASSCGRGTSLFARQADPLAGCCGRAEVSLLPRLAVSNCAAGAAAAARASSGAEAVTAAVRPEMMSPSHCVAGASCTLFTRQSSMRLQRIQDR